MNQLEATLGSSTGKIEPSADVQASHQRFSIAAEAGGRLRRLTVLLFAAWPARAFLFWHPCWTSSFSTAAGRCLGRPTLCQLVRMRYV